MRAVNIPDELWEEAQERAVGMGVTRSELARRGLMREIRWQRLRQARAAILAAKKNGGAK